MNYVQFQLHSNKKTEEEEAEEPNRKRNDTRTRRDIFYGEKVK